MAGSTALPFDLDGSRLKARSTMAADPRVLLDDARPWVRRASDGKVIPARHWGFPDDEVDDPGVPGGRRAGGAPTGRCGQHCTGPQYNGRHRGQRGSRRLARRPACGRVTGLIRAANVPGRNARDPCRACRQHVALSKR
jgi:hypothetical protein